MLPNETLLRLSCFGTGLVALWIWQSWRPFRRQPGATWQRTACNLGLVFLNGFAARVVLPLTAVELAARCQLHGVGLFAWLAWPIWLEFLLALVALDFAIYVQHVLFHAVPLFWRLHRVHHADVEFDVTTGVRFHTIEIVLSAIIKLAAVTIFGASPWAVLTFEIVLNATSMFSHTNIALPPALDRLLRWFVVTPNMHRVHHSIDRAETNSNFGFNLPWWDYLCGTYRAAPLADPQNMPIGIETVRDPAITGSIFHMLGLPWQALEPPPHIELQPHSELHSHGQPYSHGEPPAREHTDSGRDSHRV